jgi:hypothetical protein
MAPIINLPAAGAFEFYQVVLGHGYTIRISTAGVKCS